jgi:hypothetical protein
MRRLSASAFVPCCALTLAAALSSPARGDLLVSVALDGGSYYQVASAPQGGPATVSGTFGATGPGQPGMAIVGLTVTSDAPHRHGDDSFLHLTVDSVTDSDTVAHTLSVRFTDTQFDGIPPAGRW